MPEYETGICVGTGLMDLIVTADSPEHAVERLKELILSGAIPVTIGAEQIYCEKEAAVHGEDPPDDWEPEGVKFQWNIAEELQKRGGAGRN
jgi:hypothetical protein